MDPYTIGVIVGRILALAVFITLIYVIVKFVIRVIKKNKKEK